MVTIKDLSVFLCPQAFLDKLHAKHNFHMVERDTAEMMLRHWSRECHTGYKTCEPRLLCRLYHDVDLVGYAEMVDDLTLVIAEIFESRSPSEVRKLFT